MNDAFERPRSLSERAQAHAAADDLERLLGGPQPSAGGMTPAEGAATMAGLLAQMGEVMAPVREASIGYRAGLIADGFPPEEASRMAADYHGYVVTMLRTAMTSGGGGNDGTDGR